jgi:purine nucleosidase
MLSSVLRISVRILCWLPLLVCGHICDAQPTRRSAPWPIQTQRISVIIDTDAGAEIDDQYALALALGFPERLEIEGIVAAHFGDYGGPAGIERSYEEIQRVLEKAGRVGRFPVLRGSEPFTFRDRAPTSEGVRFIIEKARQATPENPLWLVMLGPATDGVAALMLEPAIADRLVLFWHGRTQWPARCWNYNVFNDIKAARLLFEQPSRLVVFDTGTHLTISHEETARRFKPLGALGAYLHAIRDRHRHFLQSGKSMFDVGDIAALINPATVRWEQTEAPTVDHDLRYNFSKKNGHITRIYHVERDLSFDLLEAALKNLNH